MTGMYTHWNPRAIRAEPENAVGWNDVGGAASAG